ncbi:hypothetical protein LF1_57180 [Rubripirellula obstinata]|uniref:Uncharacterized protein n=1 Tax=Rubripirellula obstinata TaxID=406547 RepID=A0A5B1C9M4_9BACT|nr:hypothetical protein LF1_57180 [Rubripirellula obstinata]
MKTNTHKLCDTFGIPNSTLEHLPPFLAFSPNWEPNASFYVGVSMLNSDTMITPIVKRWLAASRRCFPLAGFMLATSRRYFPLAWRMPVGCRQLSLTS